MLLKALLIAPLVARDTPPPKPAAIDGTCDNTIKAVKNTIVRITAVASVAVSGLFVVILSNNVSIMRKHKLPNNTARISMSTALTRYPNQFSNHLLVLSNKSSTKNIGPMAKMPAVRILLDTIKNDI